MEEPAVAEVADPAPTEEISSRKPIALVVSDRFNCSSNFFSKVVSGFWAIDYS